MMRTLRLLLLAAVLAAATGARGADPEVLSARANRAFEAREWASAFALYSLVADNEPGTAMPYAKAAVSAAMLADTAATSTMIERAMTHGVPLDSMLSSMERSATALGESRLYTSALLRAANDMPYVRRPVQAALLRHYMFRNDGPNIVKYATAMLAGLPDNIAYLSALARGQMLTDDFDAAFATWERILALDPDNFDTLVAYGSALKPFDAAKARALLEKACTLNPTPYLKATLAE